MLRMTLRASVSEMLWIHTCTKHLWHLQFTLLLSAASPPSPLRVKPAIIAEAGSANPAAVAESPSGPDLFIPLPTGSIVSPSLQDRARP